MRTFMLALLLFVAGYGTVVLGHEAGAYAAGNEVFELLGRKVRTLGSRASEYFREPSEPPEPTKREPAPILEREAGFTDFLDAANKAFVAMDRTCSEAARTRLGRAFYDLVAYTKGYSGRTSANRAVKVPDDLPRNFSEIDIIVQVIDATRRGVLRSRHFRPAPGKSVYRGSAAQDRAATNAVPGYQPGAGDRASLKPVAAETVLPETRLAPRLTQCPAAAQ